MSMTVTGPLAGFQSTTARSGQYVSSLRSKHISFGGVLRSEWIKTRTMMSSWAAMIAMFLIIVLLDIPMAFSALGTPDAEAVIHQSTQFALQLSVILLLNFAVACIAVVGVLSATNEYDSRQIESTLVAVPRRTEIGVAKAVVATVWALIWTIATLVVGMLAVLGVLKTRGIAFNLDGHVLRTTVVALVFVISISLLTFGLGLLLRSSAGGIAAALAMIYAVPMVLQLAQHEKWAQVLDNLLPMSLGQNLITGSIGSNVYGGLGGGLCELLAWGLVFFIAGLFALKNRDA
jgi:ABC-2 type transport system permease protein